MAEQQTQPVDIGKDEIKPFRERVEKILTNYLYKEERNLPELIRQISLEEPHIMSSLERQTYLALREGLQIYKKIASLLSDKTGLDRLIISGAESGAEKNTLRDFCYSYAAFAASVYITRKVDQAVKAEVDIDTQAGKPDLSSLSIDTTRTEESVILQLLAPVFDRLVNHIEHGREVFRTPYDFSLWVRDVFETYADKLKTKKDAYPTLEKENLEGYRFRIMDDFLTFEGFEDKSVPHVEAVEQKMTFTPVKPNEIFGNKSSKRKIARTIERLVLYDTVRKKNPILELGGLPWSTLLDGLPGTGKSTMFRMAMTLLHEYSEQIGLRYHIFTIDPSIKDEYYGKTGKIMLERLAVTKDESALTLGIWDDLDLLTSSRRDAQGADNDINNISMQYFDGVFTRRLGNVVNYAATNEPTGLDNALRNRFNDRLLVDGPVDRYDFSDMFLAVNRNLMDQGMIKIDLGKGYTPFATQDLRNPDGTWTGTDVAAYMAEEFTKKTKSASIFDFGVFMEELKVKNPTITGRSAKAIFEAIKERSADFDIPREWFSRRAAFFDLPYEKKVRALADLYAPITPDILFQEAQRYADSEIRYASQEAREQVNRGYEARVWDIQAQIRFLEEQLRLGGEADTLRLSALSGLLEKINAQASETIQKALIEAAEAEKKGTKSS